MASFTEPPDAKLDVIDGGFWTVPALGLQDLGHGVGAHREWKLEDTPVTCSDTVLLAPQRPYHILAALFPGKNDVPHPGPQRCLFVWTCRVVSAGEGFNQLIFSHGSRSAKAGACF
jgi:hypothetical protein